MERCSGMDIDPGRCPGLLYIALSGHFRHFASLMYIDKWLFPWADTFFGCINMRFCKVLFAT